MAIPSKELRIFIKIILMCLKMTKGTINTLITISEAWINTGDLPDHLR